jgi:hypothetical protein
MSTTLPEQAFAVHGDVLYRFALALVGDEGRAAQLLRALAADLPAGAASEPALLSGLLAAARREEERVARGRRRPRPAPPLGPFALTSLPLTQRAALIAHLLLGYDGQRLADLLGLAPADARAALIDAVRALGSAAGLALTDRVSDERCAPVRDLLVDPALGSRQSTAARGHLATCSHCRAFDHAWLGITQAVEAALRGALRDQQLPAPMAAKLLASGRSRPAWSLPRLALVPLIVLALIAALVLPGFLRQPVSVVDRTQSEPVDPLALLDQALARQVAPPDRSGVWYARYETIWYFADDVYAPLLAELWLDPREPARHRLQLSHREGGAPYELQLGDGARRLSYALDAAYAPALYGGLPVRASPGSPALIDQPLDAAGQLRARNERLASGPWSLAPAYLRQARAAADLRLLGRQRDGRHVVQILSFSAPSPLGLPADGPAADQVTVLLAIDVEEGLLRRVTELVGPPDGTQTSRVTWSLVAEEWLVSGDQIREAFAVQRAWTGVGDFSEVSPVPSADLAIPLVSARSLADPAQLFDLPAPPLWLPARPPPGVDRALLIWPNSTMGALSPPLGLVYLGEGRRLVMAFSYAQPPSDLPESIGAWQVTLWPGRIGRYTAVLDRDPAGQLSARQQDPSIHIRLDAWGFTRAELLELISGMGPFAGETLVAHDDLFIRPQAGADDVRALAPLDRRQSP